MQYAVTIYVNVTDETALIEREAQLEARHVLKQWEE